MGSIRNGKISITGIAVTIITIMALVNISNNDDKKSNDTSTKQTTNHNKWTEMLEYALLKNKANVAVGCKEKSIDSKSYILCKYSLFETFGDRQFALFMRDGDILYAINGTSRNLTHYQEIVKYDVNKFGTVDIVGIKDRF